MDSFYFAETVEVRQSTVSRKQPFPPFVERTTFASLRTFGIASYGQKLVGTARITGFATELVSRFYCERKALNAEALTVNTSTLTAVGNDYSFERIMICPINICIS